MSTRHDSADRSPEERIAKILFSGLEHAEWPRAGSAEEELLRVLTGLREDYVAVGRMPDAAASARMLARVRDSMSGRHRKEGLLARLTGTARGWVPRPAWAAVAVAAVAVVALLMLRLPARSVVAESGSISVVYDAPDGTVITLRPHSQLVRDGERSYVLEGEAYFDVARDESRPFTVAADDGVVEVLGTRFSVSGWGPTVRVFVDEGRVRFRGVVTGHAVELVEGEGSELVDGSPVLDAGFGRAAALDWMDGALVLDSQPLGEVVAELRQHFGLHIEFPPELEANRLSGRILLPDAEQALRDLGIVVGGEFVRTGPDTFRFERK